MKQKLASKEFFDKFFSVVELKSAKSICIIMLAVFAVMLLLLGYAFQSKSEPEVISEYKGITTQAEQEDSVQEAVKTIYVHVKGEVKSPGLYQLTDDCRINDAVKAAGGFTDNAFQDGVNLAEKLKDEQEIYILSKTEAKNGGTQTSVPDGKSAAKVIDINKATKAELESLPGIGEVYADRIIQYRTENGSFRKTEDIMKVKGISKGRFEQLKAYIKV